MSAAGLAATVVIGGRKVGPGCPTYVIAEAGSNHYGDLDVARRLIDAAAIAGCDAVKFQVFHPATLMSPTGQRASYLDRHLGGHTSLFELFESTAMDRDWLPLLAKHARERGIHLLATPFDVAAVAVLAGPDVAVPAMKNASSELWDLALVECEARTGLPLILSTGMAAIEDVEDAVQAATGMGARSICLLHCTVSYPTPAHAVNLRAMATLREHFGTPVGLSDHTLGIWASIAAVALGADLVEKHITLSRDNDGPDDAVSLEPTELNEMVARLRDTEASFGDGQKVRLEIEEEIFRIGRRNIVAVSDLRSGDRLESTSVAVLRSSLGIAPKYLNRVIGRTLAHDVRAGDPLTWSDLE